MAKQALDHSDAQRQAKSIEQLEAFTMMREELDRFKFDVQTKALYVETKFVPQAIEALQQRMENQFKELKGTIHAVQSVGQEQVSAIANKVIDEAKGYIQIQVAEGKNEIAQGVLQMGGMQANGYEPLRGHVANLGMQQEGMAQEIFQMVARIQVIENVTAQGACPCVNGRCPCKCNNGANGGQTTGAKPQAATESFCMSPSGAWDNRGKNGGGAGDGGDPGGDGGGLSAFLQPFRAT